MIDGIPCLVIMYKMRFFASSTNVLIISSQLLSPKGLTLDFHGDISIPTCVPTRHNHIETGLPAGDVVHQFSLADITIFPMISNHPSTLPKPCQKSQYVSPLLRFLLEWILIDPKHALIWTFPKILVPQ